MSMLGFGIACVTLSVASSSTLLAMNLSRVSTQEKFRSKFRTLMVLAIVLCLLTVGSYIWAQVSYPVAFVNDQETMRRDHAAGWLYIFQYLTVIAWGMTFVPRLKHEK